MKKQENDSTKTFQFPFWKFLLGFVLALFMVIGAYAQTTIFVDLNATGHNNGGSWPHAFVNLQDALDAASSSDVDEIRVAQGIYYPTKLLFSTSTDYRDKAFNISNKDVIVSGGWNAGTGLQNGGATYLDGDLGTISDVSDNAYHLLVTVGLTSNSVFKDLTLLGGYADLSTAASYAGQDIYRNRGGGMYNYSSSPRISNVVFFSNTGVYGGGMFNSNSSSPTLTDVIFSYNSASANGGGMFNYLNSSPSLTNVSFEDNVAYSNGGGMVNNNASSPSLSNVSFENNTAFNGGGMFNYYSAPDLENVAFEKNDAKAGGGMLNEGSSPTLKKVNFVENTASLYGGGGMYNYLDCYPSLTDVNFINNSATDNTNGGGLFNWTSSPSLVNVSFENNSAFNGGGMCNDVSSSPSLENVTFKQNEAFNNGGGMFNNDNSSPSLIDVSFLNNSAGAGGGLLNKASSPNLLNVIFVGNSTYKEGGGGMVNYNYSDADLTNVIFIDNTAFINETAGAGMLIVDNSSANLTNVSFVNNSGNFGSGIYIAYQCSISLTNVLFFNNTDGASSLEDIVIDETSSLTVGEYNASDVGTGSGLNGRTGFVDLSSTDATDLFTDYSNLIGDDGIWATDDDGLVLKEESSLIGAGTGSLAPTTDIIGVTRPSPPSIGAYEGSEDNILPNPLLVSSYTIISFYKEVKLEGSNVSSGGVTALGDKGKVEIDKDSKVTGSNTFVKADEIKVKSGGEVDTEIEEEASLSLPSFVYNPNCKNKDVEDVSVDDNESVTLTGDTYGKVYLKKNAKVTFTSDVLYLEELKTSYDDTIAFTSDCVQIMVCKKVELKKNNIFNAEGKSVTLFVEEDFKIEKNSAAILNVYSLKHIHSNGDKNNDKNELTGLFIAETVHSIGTNWNWNKTSDGCETIQNKVSTKPIADLEGLINPNVIQINTYPNPNDGNFQVEIVNISEGSYNVSVCDLTGSVVFTTGEHSFSGPTNIEISLDASANGYYYVRALINGKMYNTKVIVQQR